MPSPGESICTTLVTANTAATAVATEATGEDVFVASAAIPVLASTW